MKTAGQTNSAANSAIVANSALKILDVSVLVTFSVNLFAISQRFMLSKSSFRED